MPATSAKQYRLAAMIKHHKPIKGLGMPLSVAKEMVDKTPLSMRSAFMKGKRK